MGKCCLKYQALWRNNFIFQGNKLPSICVLRFAFKRGFAFNTSPYFPPEFPSLEKTKFPIVFVDDIWTYTHYYQTFDCISQNVLNISKFITAFYSLMQIHKVSFATLFVFHIEVPPTPNMTFSMFGISVIVGRNISRWKRLLFFRFARSILKVPLKYDMLECDVYWVTLGGDETYL